MNVAIATCQHALDESRHLLHPSSVHVVTTWLAEARRCASAGNKSDAAKFLLMADTRLEQEGAWQRDRFGVETIAGTVQ